MIFAIGTGTSIPFGLARYSTSLTVPVPRRWEPRLVLCTRHGTGAPKFHQAQLPASPCCWQAGLALTDGSRLISKRLLCGHQPAWTTRVGPDERGNAMCCCELSSRNLYSNYVRVVWPSDVRCHAGLADTGRHIVEAVRLKSTLEDGKHNMSSAG